MLEIIAQNSQNPGRAMKTLQMSYVISRGESRNIIRKKDVQKASELLEEKKPRGNN